MKRQKTRDLNIHLLFTSSGAGQAPLPTCKWSRTGTTWPVWEEVHREVDREQAPLRGARDELPKSQYQARSGKSARTRCSCLNSLFPASPVPAPTRLGSGKNCTGFNQEGLLVEVEHVKAQLSKKELQHMSHFERFVTEGFEKAEELAKEGVVMDGGVVAQV